MEWDIRLSGFYGIFTGMIKKHMLKGSEEALERISDRPEERSARFVNWTNRNIENIVSLRGL